MRDESAKTAVQEKMSSSTIDEIYHRMSDDTEAPIETINENESEIQKFFAGKSVLLTGATGFMGKIFVEKLLRSCRDIKTLYVVVRRKRGVSQEEKMKKYFEHVIFEKLREENPDFVSKVVTIKGDLQEHELGLSAEDRALLIENVNIIVHSGATTKFDEKVSIALKINVLATKFMLDLALQCKHIQAFVYVSTAYSHCYQQDIEEKFYEAPADLKAVYDIIESDENSANGITEEAMAMLLGKWANVYTFTKSMAEDLVRQYGEKANFACGVYRPSIVSATYEEPIRGWTGNNNGPASVFLGIGLGFIHTVYYQFVPMDLIPVDYSINSLLATIYDLPQRWKKEKRSVVYNYGSSTINPVYVHIMFTYLMKVIEDIGSTYVLWYPFMLFTSSKLLFFIAHFLFHFIPAILADIVLIVTKRKPRCLSLFWFGTKHLSKIFYFTNGNWRIHVPEMMKVNDRLNETDRKIFPFDLRNIDWEDFTITYTRCTRVHILKENMDNTIQSRKHTQRMKMIHRIVTPIYVLVVAYYVFRLFCYLFSVVF